MGMVALFSAGRILSYVALATAASFATAGLREVLADPREARYLMGTIMVLTALWLLYRQFHETSHRCAAGSMFSHIGALGPLGTFVMGALLSVNLCAPLLSLLSVASATGSPWQGALFGLAFGMGSVLVSLFFYGFVLAAISKELLFQFKRQKVYIESVASALLLVAGVMVATGHLKL